MKRVRDKEGSYQLQPLFAALSPLTEKETPFRREKSPVYTFFLQRRKTVCEMKIC